jgi:hypothetical protein
MLAKVKSRLSRKKSKHYSDPVLAPGFVSSLGETNSTLSCEDIGIASVNFPHNWTAYLSKFPLYITSPLEASTKHTTIDNICIQAVFNPNGLTKVMNDWIRVIGKEKEFTSQALAHVKIAKRDAVMNKCQYRKKEKVMNEITYMVENGYPLIIMITYTSMIGLANIHVLNEAIESLALVRYENISWQQHVINNMILQLPRHFRADNMYLISPVQYLSKSECIERLQIRVIRQTIKAFLTDNKGMIKVNIGKKCGYKHIQKDNELVLVMYVFETDQLERIIQVSFESNVGDGMVPLLDKIIEKAQFTSIPASA